MKNKYPLAELAAALAAEGEPIAAGTFFTGISTDTRTVGEGEVFIALCGDCFDAHDFLELALERGALALCVSDAKKAEPFIGRCAVLLVPDTREALLSAAAWYRDRLKTRVIAVTGSVGKTSTRDMIFAALRGAAPDCAVARTAANLNNEIGVAHTLLETDEDCDFQVIELGIAKPGDMAKLAAMSKPDVAVVTNVGYSHMEFFGSREAIASEKLDIARELRPGGWLLINGDDPLLAAWASGFEAVSLCRGGCHIGCIHLLNDKFKASEAQMPEQLPVTGIELSLTATVRRLDANGSAFVPVFQADRASAGKLIQEIIHKNDLAQNSIATGCHDENINIAKKETRFLPCLSPGETVTLEIYGEHSIRNALFGLFCATLFGLNRRGAAAGVRRYEPTGRRQSWRDGQNLFVLDDSYNASPESMREAFRYLAALRAARGGRSIAALGCINELGNCSEKLHEQIGRYLAETDPDLVFFCGSEARAMAAGYFAARQESGQSADGQSADEQSADARGEGRLFLCRDRESLINALLPRLRAHDILLVKASHGYEMHKVAEAAWNLLEDTTY